MHRGRRERAETTAAATNYGERYVVVTFFWAAPSMFAVLASQAAVTEVIHSAPCRAESAVRWLRWRKCGTGRETNEGVNLRD